MKNCLNTRAAAFALAAAALLAGCRSTPNAPAPAAMFQAAAGGLNLDAGSARARELKRPLIILVAELGQSRADDEACASFESPSVKATHDRSMTVVLDISVSRNRATATRFHVTETPVLLCLSSRGIIISRDEKRITKSLVLKRIEEARQESPELDGQLVSLEKAAGNGANDVAAQFQLTDFLLDHHNSFEAIPLLATIAHSEANASALRIRAWVALARAHYWIAEPEKGRHEADALLATLGPRTPEARAGGEFALGLQDASAKRPALARQEFEDAIAAAPDSPYGKQAAAALANLPNGIR